MMRAADSDYRCWAEVDLNALRQNLDWIRRRAGPRIKIITVVKADAYGHGLKQIAAVLMQSGSDMFGVANLTEARDIRTVGTGWPVLMLGACLPNEVERAIRDDVTPTLSSLEEARRFSEAAGKLRKSSPVHIKVDTGMGRLGVAPGLALALVREVRRLPGLQLQGFYTHFASVEDDPAFTRRQRTLFRQVLARLAAASIVIPMIHASNSGALLFERVGVGNAVRPGLLVYGVIPGAKRKISPLLKQHLRPALTWRCAVSFIKDIPRGAPVSYGRTFIAGRRMRVATITAGYGDGYPRAASNRASVLIRGRRCPVIGRVTMDQTLVDVTETSDTQPGDEVVLIGSQCGETITAGELARWCNTVPWEALTNISARVQRVYTGVHAA